MCVLRSLGVCRFSGTSPVSPDLLVYFDRANGGGTKAFSVIRLKIVL